MATEARRTPDARPDAGAHEVLRDRMAAAAADLAARARALNDRRVEAFGGAGLELAGAARLDTGRPRVPKAS
ncbi:hypothetical protein, partial [Streptomyces atacamensis]|uniref:hypothetical protein n=1 Tax=Streptomyces atacamensis TaxID=531966 RepID=UPI00399C9D2B